MYKLLTPNTRTKEEMSNVDVTIRPNNSSLYMYYPTLSRFSTWRICSREQRKKQLDWLMTNTDVITSQSHSLFACSREQIRQVKNRLKIIVIAAKCRTATNSKTFYIAV